ncbi:PAS domain S-box protein [Luteithermobacter gelatinilyticus]|uniref:sensor histidine kinase n=1 Tax=Luteithermobacter gelatinilyticus TaxID=2582913 RepID=UPI0011068BB5|nr:PAS domain S-box protein [Luteithermobacter gelatinilyticus]
MTQDWNKLGSYPEALQEIIQFAEDGIISLDQNQNIVLFNNGAEKIFGYASKEVLGQPLTILLPASSRKAHKRYIETFSRTAQTSRIMSKTIPLYGKARDGREVPLEITIQKHRGASPIRFTAICRDISHRLCREQRLAENHAKFKAIFNSSNRLIILMDDQGRILEINRTARTFLGQDQANYVGQEIWRCDFWNGEIYPAMVRYEIKHLKDDGFSRLTAQITSCEGRSMSLDMSLKKFATGPEGEMLIVLEAVDVTRLVKTNEALKESENRLARAQQIAHLGNWEWNISTNEIYWSDEVYRIFGLTPDIFEASYAAFLATIHEKDRPKVEKAVEHALKSGKPYSIIHRIICPDGKEKIVHELGEVLRNERGEPLSMTGTVQDITESWHREKALAEARNQAEAANRAKSQFLATMSHELRTPLNAIIGFSSGMQKGLFGNSPAQYREYAGYILESGQHLLSIINDILDLSRIEVGAVQVKPDWIRAEELITGTLRYITEKALAKNIAIQTDIDADIPDLYLDKRLCRQIMSNLLTNAVKFTDSGGKIIMGARLHASPENIPEGDVEIYVQDTGIGMKAEDIDKVFRPFAQADMSFTRNHEGVGLGLAIVKNLTELQGGRVTINSTPDVGTCVSVFFPVKAKIFSE